MKAILIDPVAQTVTEVEHDESRSLESIYELIKADCFDVVTINDQRDGIYVDDEGLFEENLYIFEYDAPERLMQPLQLAGRGLILGCDDEGGRTIEATITVEEVLSRVRFRGLCHLA